MTPLYTGSLTNNRGADEAGQLPFWRPLLGNVVGRISCCAIAGRQHMAVAVERVHVYEAARDMPQLPSFLARAGRSFRLCSKLGMI
jgi:hypothetical protein